MKSCFSILFVILLAGCYPENGPEFPDGPVNGYRPVYGDSAEIYSVVQENARELKEPGKIYVYGNLLLVNEKFGGIHVFNNADPSHPKNLYFISIPGNIDMAVKNNVLYADNYEDLVLIHIDQQGIKQSKRINDALYSINNKIPPEHGYFECVDPEKGPVLGWEYTTIEHPNCYH